MSSSSSSRGNGDNSRLPLYSLVATSNSSVDERSSTMETHGSLDELEETQTPTRQPYRPAGTDTHDFDMPSKLLAWSWPSMPTKARFLADFTLGFADGLTVPFALTAGLSSLGRTETVVYAGVAEICAGSISMGISGYLSARGDGAATERTQQAGCGDEEDHRDAIHRAPEDGEKVHRSSASSLELMDYLRPLDLPPALFGMVVEHVREQPHIAEALTAIAEKEQEDDVSLCSPVMVGVSVSLGYFLGGLLPLFPYLVVDSVGEGLFWSFGICLVALFAFGFIKDFILNCQRRKEDTMRAQVKTNHVLQWRDVRHGAWEGLQMVLLGGAAALAAVLCVRSFEGLREAPSDISA
jgi:VIT1/CCC1 family predicted Fe2+/Mn2+ transporter